MMQQWSARVTDVEGDSFTALLTPAGHERPELIADFSMTQCGVDVEPGDLLTVTPESVVKVDLGAWTQEEVDDISHRAKELSQWLNENVM